MCGSTATIGPARADVVDRRGDEDDPVGERAAQSRHVASLPAAILAVAAAGVDDQLVAGRMDRRRGALEQLGAERLDVGDEDPEDVGAMAAQAARDEARLVAELLDHRLDPGRRVGGDAVAVVDHLRHRGDGHPGLGGDVPDRHSAVRHGGQHSHGCRTVSRTLSITIDRAPRRVSGSPRVSQQVITRGN